MNCPLFNNPVALLLFFVMTSNHFNNQRSVKSTGQCWNPFFNVFSYLGIMPGMYVDYSDLAWTKKVSF
jgi:hypothetical protein